MKWFKMVIFAWYFAVAQSPYAGHTSVVGPFETQEDCNAVRSDMMNHNFYNKRYYSWCWHKR